MAQMICAGGLSVILLLLSVSGLSAETLLQRGEYLVNAVMGCDGCHTPRIGAGLDLRRRFSGGSQVWDTPQYTVRGSNISQDPETGIGAWSIEDIKRLLTEGVRPNGVPVVPQMPFPFYKILTGRDLDAVATYVKSIAPVTNQVAAPNYKAPAHAEPVPNAGRPFAEEDLRDPLKRGFYLATIAHCMECHSRRPNGVKDYLGWQGKGGYVFHGPFGQVPARNISSHKEKGIGSWRDAELRQALVKGIDRDGRSFHLPMARHIYYSKMTDQDLDALIAWVRTIPPIE